MVKLVLILFLATLVVGGCDTIQPAEEGLLVVSFFPETNKPLPELRVTQSVLLNKGSRLVDEVFVADAEVVVFLAGQRVVFEPLFNRPGYYGSSKVDTAYAGNIFRVEITRNKEKVWATGEMPPVISIDSTEFEFPPIPIEAVFADSLGFEVETGYMYPVDISLYWPVNDFYQNDTTFWIQAGLIRPENFPSAVLDFFLKEESVIQESSIIQIWNQKKRWKGIYAVPVEAVSDELPTHLLKIYVIRSNQDYARYVVSRGTPEVREPVHNVNGGLGIVAGISLDSLILTIE